MSGRNQYKPNPPIDAIEAPLRRLWARQDLNDRQILDRLLKRHIDQEKYGLGITRFREMRRTLGLLTVRQQDHDAASISGDMMILRQQYPKAGREDLRHLLQSERAKRVSRRVIDEWVDTWEPDLKRQRRHGKLQRKNFYAAGCNDIWALDQHDKWKQYGLGLHVAIDPFTGKVIWLKIWWGNRNPRLIFKFYLDAVRELGYMPLICQTDPGAENWGVAKGHTFLRHCLDILLADTIQHRWRRKKKNIPPEIFWSGLRRRWSPGFEDILSAPERLDDIDYDRADPVHYNIFKWLFIPWLQHELDLYKTRINATRKRYQRNKVLPQGGCPDDIEEFPEEYGCVNFKVPISANSPYLAEAESLFAPPSHPTFELVPPTFLIIVTQCYKHLGSPEVNRSNVWRIYSALLPMVLAGPVDPEWEGFPEEEEESNIPVDEEYLAELEQGLRDLRPLPDAGEYEGGVNEGYGLDADMVDVYVEGFSSDEDPEDEMIYEEDGADEDAVADFLLS